MYISICKLFKKASILQNLFRFGTVLNKIQFILKFIVFHVYFLITIKSLKEKLPKTALSFPKNNQSF